MRLIEVLVTVLTVSLIIGTGVFCYISANRSFASVRNSSVGIRTVIRTDMRIKELIRGENYSYLDSKKKVVERIEKKIRSADLGQVKITGRKSVFENSQDIFSAADVGVSWVLDGKEYISHALY